MWHCLSIIISFQESSASLTNGILNREENLKYAHVLVDMEHSPTLRVILRSWWVISTQGPIIRAIRYGVSTGLMLPKSVRNTADIKKLPGIHVRSRGVIFL